MPSVVKFFSDRRLGRPFNFGKSTLQKSVRHWGRVVEVRHSGGIELPQLQRLQQHSPFIPKLRLRVPRLDRMAATPSKSDPSMMTIAISFLIPHVPYLFSCRKGDSAVNIQVEAISGTPKLRVTGDIEAFLLVPFDDDDRFVIGLSDGTLMQGIYDEKLVCTWSVLTEGAGIVRFHRYGFTLDWKTEWVAVSCHSAAQTVVQTSKPLPLFPDLDRKVA